MSIFHSLYTGLVDASHVWRKEMIQLVKDEGVLIFLVVVPIVYPLLYSWIYNNEVVHEVPVCVVDDSHSHLSRQFICMCDASPDVRVAYYAQDLDEAKSLVSRQLVKGIYYIPSSFEADTYGMKQGTIGVYCDMSLMLTYKAIFQTAQTVTMDMGSKLTRKLGGHYTKREEVIAARPLAYDDVPLFNPSGGYGSSVLPAVLMLILQQTLVLGIGLSAGTARDENAYRCIVPVADARYSRTLPIVLGKAFCYFMVFIVMGAWLAAAIPHIFHFPQLATWQSLLILMLPYLLACIFFGMMVSCMVKYRENVMLLVVFISVPLLFLTGVSWPESNIPSYWQGVSWLFPSTFGARAYIRLNSMGASIDDVLPELRILWIHAICYFVLTLCVYRFQIYEARKFAMERLQFLRHNRAAAAAQKESEESVD